MDPLQSRLAAALGGRYTVERQVGRGGMAVVYLGRDPRLERPVAIKVLRPELSATLGTDRFLREIKVAAQLNHPYILKLHESGESGGLLYYVMPFVEGDTLRQRVTRQRTIPAADALSIAQEVAEALDHAHRQNVVHRDIKPENILFEEGHALVADFGIARAISVAGDRDTSGGMILGTVDYMSPEQEAGREDIDGRTDIYSLGIVLYEMLVGATPGPDHGVDSLRKRRPDLPPAIVTVLRRALARERTERYATARDLATALAAARGTGQQRERRRIRMWQGGVATLALGALAVYGLTRQPPEPPLDPTHLAVLYFDDLSPDGRLTHIASGLTHDLIEALTQVPVLRVTSPDGVKPYRGHARSLDSMAHELGVGTIVAGSVVGSRGRLRVEVRLVDPVTGAQLAAETFERPEGELFSLQDTLTAEVSAALRSRLGREIEIRRVRAGTRRPEAWELLQRASEQRDETERVTPDDPAAAASVLLRADSLASLAERADRNWVEPVVLRGWLAYDLAGVPMQGSPTTGTVGGVATTEWLRRARTHAERALEMESGDPRALLLRGTVLYRWWFLQGGGDTITSAARLADAERDLRAAAGVPHRDQARAWATLSALLQLQGKVEQAYVAAQRAYEVDAYFVNAAAIVFRLFHTSFQLARDVEATRWCDLGGVRFPSDWLFLDCRLSLLGFAPDTRPDLAEAWQTVAGVRDIAPAQYRTWVEPRLRMRAAAVIARAGHRDSAEQVIRGARRASPNDPELLYLEALARIQLGQLDSAVGLVAATLRDSPDARAYLRHDRQLRALVGRPGFRDLVGTAAP